MGCGQPDQRTALYLGTSAGGCVRHPTASDQRGRVHSAGRTFVQPCGRISKNRRSFPPVSHHGGDAGNCRPDRRESGFPDGLRRSGHGTDEYLFQSAAAHAGRRFRSVRRRGRSDAAADCHCVLCRSAVGSDPRAADAHGVSLCRNAGCRRKPVRQAAAVRGGDDPFHLRLAADNGAAALYAVSHCQRYFCRYSGQRTDTGGKNRHFRRGAGGGRHYRRGVGNRAGRCERAEGNHRGVRTAGSAGSVRLSFFAAGNSVSALPAGRISGFCDR